MQRANLLFFSLFLFYFNFYFSLASPFFSGMPTPQITWYFNGNAITQNTDRSHIHANGTLIINNPLVEDSGVYKCEAANYLGSISAIANVKVNGEFDKFIFNSTRILSAAAAVWQSGAVEVYTLSIEILFFYIFFSVSCSNIVKIHSCMDGGTFLPHEKFHF